MKYALHEVRYGYEIKEGPRSVAFVQGDDVSYLEESLGKFIDRPNHPITQSILSAYDGSAPSLIATGGGYDKLFAPTPESVPVRENALDWQRRGLSYTASGYGDKIPTSQQIWLFGRWRRVYVHCYSNAGTAYVIYNRERVIVDSLDFTQAKVRG